MNSAISDRLSNVEADIEGVVMAGYFRNAYAEQLGMAGSQPTLTVLDSQIPDIALGQSVLIGENSYTVVEVQPDGTGMTLLFLRRA